MFKFAGTVVDPYDDLALWERPEIAAMVHARQLTSPADVHDLADSAFALVTKTAAAEHRHYPVTTPQATKLSAFYFASVMDNLPAPMRSVAGRNLKLAHARHGLPVPAALAGDFGNGNGNRVILSRTDMQKAAGPAPVAQDPAAMLAFAQDQWLARYDQTRPENRCLTAASIAQHAESMGKLASVDPRIMDYVPCEKVGSFIHEASRRRLDALRKVASPYVGDFERLALALPHANARRVVELLQRFDKLAGLENQYGKGLPDPYRSAYAGKSKLVRDFTDPTHHKLFTIVEQQEALRKAIGPARAGEFQRDPVVFYDRKATAAEKVLLDAMLDSIGKERTWAEANDDDASWLRGQAAKNINK